MERAIPRLLKPRSVAIIGASADPGAMGSRALASLERFAFPGPIHLVNPKRSEIGGRPCVPTIDDLPDGVDVAILAIPGVAVPDAVAACARKNVGGAVVYSAGFAEVGAEGAEMQAELVAHARKGGVAVVGPNCIGLVNYVDGVPLTSGPVMPMPGEGRRRLAVIAQSGGMMGCLISASEARGLPLSHAVSTGNEAVLGVEDYLEAILEDPRAHVIALFVEALRDPKRFLGLLRRARTLGKAVVLLHSGRSERSREAALSHTGAVASNYAAMEAAATAAGAVLVDGIDALLDVAEILTRFPLPPQAGVGIVTDSGAFKGLALDLCDSLGLEIPELEARTLRRLEAILPDYAEASNPLDLTAQAMRDMERMYGGSMAALDADPNIGSLLVCLLPGAPHVVSAKVEAVLREAGSLAKPLMLVILGGEGPLPDTVRAMAAQAGVPLHRSSDRCLGALAVVTALGRTRGVDPEGPENQPSREVLPPLPARGTIPEYKAKAWLAEVMGLPIPAAALARDVEDAVAIAERLGYPVVMKVQAAALPHKSDVGGVVVGIHDATGARAAWDRIQAGASVALKGGSIDGILVEAMGEPGVELVLGARRDPQWGASVMVGLGGIWIEVLKDVRLLPASACSPEAVRAALERLRGYPLLTGIRGAPPVDLDALVDLVVRLAEVMEREPDIEEIDINPVIIHPRGKGALALDALIVTRGDGATA